MAHSTRGQRRSAVRSLCPRTATFIRCSCTGKTPPVTGDAAGRPCLFDNAAVREFATCPWISDSTRALVWRETVDDRGIELPNRNTRSRLPLSVPQSIDRCAALPPLIPKGFPRALPIRGGALPVPDARSRNEEPWTKGRQSTSFGIRGGRRLVALKIIINSRRLHFEDVSNRETASHSRRRFSFLPLKERSASYPSNRDDFLALNVRLLKLELRPSRGVEVLSSYRPMIKRRKRVSFSAHLERVSMEDI